MWSTAFLSHLAQSTDNRPLGETPDNPAGFEEPLGSTAVATWHRRGSQSPEEVLLENERRQIGHRALQMLIASCAGDQLLLDMINLMQEGVLKSAPLAEQLQVPVADIYNGSKRLDRKYGEVARKIREELKIGGHS